MPFANVKELLSKPIRKNQEIHESFTNMLKPWLLHKVNLPILKIWWVEFCILKVNPLSSVYFTETQKDVWQYSFSVTAVKSLKNTCERINFQLYWLPCYFSLYERKNIYQGYAVKYCNCFIEVDLRITLVDYFFQGFPWKNRYVSYKSISNAETSSSATALFRLKGIFAVA